MKTPNHFSLDPIGVIHSHFTRPEDVPIQPVYANEESATIEVFERYAEGLQDLAGFERIWLLYWFHKAPEARLRVVPFRDTEERDARAVPTRPGRHVGRPATFDQRPCVARCGRRHSGRHPATRHQTVRPRVRRIQRRTGKVVRRIE